MIEVLPPNINIAPESAAGNNSAAGSVDVSAAPGLSELRPGTSVILDILQNSPQSAAKQLAVSISSSLTDSFLKIPLTLNLDQPLDLPPQTTQIAARITARINGKIELRLSLPAAPRSETAAPLQPSDSAAVRVNSPPELNLPLPPLKAAPMIAQVLKNMDLPPQTVEMIGQAVKNIEIPLTVRQVLPPSAVVDNEISAPPAVAEVISRITGHIRNFDFSDPRQIPQLVRQLVEILQPLAGQQLTVRPTAVPGSPLLMVTTPLGEVLPDIPLKLTPETVLQLQLGTPLSDENVLDRLPDLLNSRLLLQNLISPDSLLQPRPGGHSLGRQALDEFLKIFTPLHNHSQQPVLAARILGRLPAPGNDFLANLTAFVRASESGSVGSWLGTELTSVLNNLGPEGKETIGNLQNFLAANSKEGVSWRMVEIPFFTGDAISKIRIAIKKQAEKEDKQSPAKKSKNGTRFVVDTNFSRLGGFQFDGFSFAKGRRFDLIIRTGQNIPPGLIADIMRIFKNTLHQVGYIGNVQVNVKENFIKICDDMPQTTLNKEGIYI